ncbi:hypothetical protein SAMN04488002_2755 [Litoreibacter janthinus]|uniref:Uncharacterized protein n=1 Tax=Litoreibacter janthinus TaxID=670154 RepID=A0A1I6HAQ3_9RHOB|nr:hypothetical protein SAMN04488002_2755 [Litoreibacter janthinus]
MIVRSSKISSTVFVTNVSGEPGESGVSVMGPPASLASGGEAQSRDGKTKKRPWILVTRAAFSIRPS